MSKIDINMPAFMGLTQQYFNPSDINTIMEIGSLNGNDSLYFKDIFPDATVYCIEGLPDNFTQYLSHQTKIIPINIVVADYNGTVTFHKKDINGIHGIHNRGNQFGTETVQLPCMTIHSLCEKYLINTIDLVKIDVEGATYEVLNSMGPYLKTIKIMHIETETYPFFEGQKLHDEVEDFLIRNEFTMIDSSRVYIDRGGYQMDSVWLNNKYLK